MRIEQAIAIFKELYTEYADSVDLRNSLLGEKDDLECIKFLVLQGIKLNSECNIEYLLDSYE